MEPGKQIRSSHIAPMLILLGFSILFRLLTLMPIHPLNGDNRTYWTSAQALSLGEPYPLVRYDAVTRGLNHKSVRWGLILPATVVQWLFGTHPNVYYLFPIAVTSITALLLYWFVRRIGDRTSAFLISLGYLLFPYMIRMGSQLRLNSIIPLYALTALVLFTRYMKTGRRVWLLASAGMIFCAYLTKITSLYLAGGFIAAVLIYGGGTEGQASLGTRLVDALLFCGILLACYLIETAVYWQFAEIPLGRLGLIKGTHLQARWLENEWKGSSGFLSLFGRIFPPHAPIYWTIPILLYPAAAFFLHKRRSDRYIDTIALVGLSYLLAVILAIQRLNPIAPVEPFRQRYLMPALAPMVIIEVLAGVDLVRMSRIGRRLLAPCWRLPVFAALPGALLSVCAIIFAVAPFPDSLAPYYTERK